MTHPAAAYTFVYRKQNQSLATYTHSNEFAMMLVQHPYKRCRSMNMNSQRLCHQVAQLYMGKEMDTQRESPRIPEHRYTKEYSREKEKEERRSCIGVASSSKKLTTRRTFLIRFELLLLLALHSSSRSIKEQSNFARASGHIDSSALALIRKAVLLRACVYRARRR